MYGVRHYFLTFDDGNRLTNSYEEKTSAGSVVATLWQAGYGYDNANRLTSFVPNPMAQNNPPPTVTMTHDSDNQLATYNGQAVGHDLDGNLLSAPVSGTLGALTWDTRNRLTSAGGVTYAYDSENRRTMSVATSGTTKYAYSRGAKLDQLLVKQNPDGSITRYIHGEGLLYEETTNAAGVAQSPVYYHYDWRGDTVALSDATGSVTARLSYSPYGVPTVESGTVTTPFCFNGKWGVMTESSGLLSMQARYYSTTFQRFLNEDPSGFNGGVNLYAYANGDPIDFTDPFGLCPASSGYLHDVGQMWVGYGMAARDTAVGLYNTVAHPINTATGIYNVASHPVQAYNAISQSVSDTWNSGYAGKGQIIGNALITAATVGAGTVKGVQAAGTAGRGLEFSHWIPARVGGGRSLLNGNFVDAATHALSDPYRYRFMPKVWKAENPMPSVISQQWTRLPDVYKGTGAGLIITGAAHAGADGE